MSLMKHKYRLGVQHPSINKLINTEHFKLSEQILELRKELNLSVEEAAKKSGLSFEEYFDLEWAETDISVDKYKETLNVLKQYSHSKHLNNTPSEKIMIYRENLPHYKRNSNIHTR